MLQKEPLAPNKSATLSRPTLKKDREDVKTVDELVDHYSKFNKKLVDLFELVSRSTECEATREMFDSLATVERQNARDLS